METDLPLASVKPETSTALPRPCSLTGAPRWLLRLRQV
jgi:hypothetical protein